MQVVTLEFNHLHNASCSIRYSTMPLALYGHPFSSYTQKVLIALYENGSTLR